MRIVVDARWIFPEISGIGLYTQELIRAWTRMETRHTFVLLFASAEIRDRTLGPHPGRLESHIVPYGLFSIQNQLRLPGLLRRLKADVYHSTNWMMPLLSGGGARRIVTIHDLIPLIFRDHAPRSRKARLFPLYQWLMRRVGQRADRIVTVSQSTRRDIEQHLRCASSKISVTVEGVRPEFRPSDQAPADPPRILYVGRRDPYKNLPLLIEAFADAAKRVPTVRLRVIGPADSRYPQAPRMAESLGINDRIDWVGYASPEDLIREYQRATAFVLPSRYEGFGLTVLEAMACGTPVICSRISSLPEVVGDAARLVPPDDRAALADALVDVLTQPELARDLHARGLARAASFTWERAARETIAAYEETCRA